MAFHKGDRVRIIETTPSAFGEPMLATTGMIGKIGIYKDRCTCGCGLLIIEFPTIFLYIAEENLSNVHLTWWEIFGVK